MVKKISRKKKTSSKTAPPPVPLTAPLTGACGNCGHKLTIRLPLPEWVAIIPPVNMKCTECHVYFALL